MLSKEFIYINIYKGKQDVDEHRDEDANCLRLGKGETSR